MFSIRSSYDHSCLFIRFLRFPFLGNPIRIISFHTFLQSFPYVCLRFPTVLFICFLWSFHTFLPTWFQVHATAQGSFPKFSYYLRSAYVFIWFHKFFVMPVRPLFPIVFLRSSYVFLWFPCGYPAIQTPAIFPYVSFRFPYDCVFVCWHTIPLTVGNPGAKRQPAPCSMASREM